MKLVVQRAKTVGETTLGNLSVDGVSFCDTLEDVVREVPGTPVGDWKVAGKTAIPAGVYRLAAVNSPRFGPDTLTVMDVPGFTHIRIHAGNVAADTQGCLLVGYKTAPEFISWSQMTLQKLKGLVLPVLRKGQTVTIEYRNAKEKA